MVTIFVDKNNNEPSFRPILVININLMNSLKLAQAIGYLLKLKL